jgi:hemoglobin/transferrin/lactoferrin receptor protein
MVVLQNQNRRIGTFPNGFMGQMLNVYGIERIEVIRGPGSVMYGTGAISGVINLISADPLNARSFTAELASGFGSNNYERFVMPRINWGNGRIGITVLGRLRKADDYKFGADSTAINSYIEDKDFSIRFGWRIKPNHTLRINSDYHEGGPWAKPLGYTNKPQIKNVHEDNTSHTSVNYRIENNGFIQTTVISGFYDLTHRDQHTKTYTGPFNLSTSKLKKYALINYKLRYGGGQIYGVLKPIATHQLSIGLDGYASRLWGPTTEINYQKQTTTHTNNIDNAGISSIGMYAQDEWPVAGNVLSIITGLRYDVAEVQEGFIEGEKGRNRKQSAFSGTVGLINHPSHSTSLTLNIGRAFRMPGADEMFSDMISGAGIKHGNPELTPEYSWNVDAGFRGTINDFDFDASVYTNFLVDFVNEIAAPPGADYDYTYENIGKARISGYELSATYRFRNLFDSGKHLMTSTSMEYTYGVDVTGKDSYFTPGEPVYAIPPLRIRASVRYLGISKLFGLWNNHFIEFEADHSEAQHRVPKNIAGPWGTEESAAFTLFSVRVGLNLNALPLSPKIHLRIRNLLDEVYKPFGSFIPGMGRNIKLIVRLSI